MDFYKFKKDGKNIDELFDAQKRPTYKEMLRYCRHLYRESTKRKNEYEKEQDQAEQQFRREFRRFLKDNEMTGNVEKNITELKNAFKIFILFKSSKITGVDYPLDYNSVFLADEKNVFQLEDIMSDSGSVARLDGQYSSQNGIQIEKLYALLWINLVLSEDDFRYFLEYITLFEDIAQKASNKYLCECLRSTVQEGITSLDRPIDGVFIYKLTSKMCKKMENKIIELLNLKKIERRIPFFVYYILKIYIRNKIKTNGWRRGNNGEEGFVNDLLGVEAREKIYKITENKKIKEGPDDLFQILIKGTHIHPFTQEEQNIILNTIFPDDERSIEEKRNQLKRDFRKIYILYINYGLKMSAVKREIGENDVYNIIIAAYIFYRIEDRNINFLKFTEAGQTKDRKRPTRSNFVNGYLKYILKNEINEKHLKKSVLNMGYLEVPVLFFMEYNYLFDPKSNEKIKEFKEIRECVNYNIYNLWDTARVLNKRFLSLPSSPV